MTLATTFTLTLANPMTILSFTAIFAGLGLSLDSDRASSALLVAGVFAGSMLWWVLLTGGVTLLRRRLDERWIRRINTASALVILMFATISVGSVIF
jgi:putative LysE/RhtB family amino acid efflux pump